MGGSNFIENHHFWTSGPRTPHFINFLKFLDFLQKRSRFRPPKSTPKVNLLKMPFPTKTPVLLLQWGSENVTFWGVGRRTGFCKKCRHYYIAIFDFLDIFGPQILSIFNPAERNRFFIWSRPNLSDVKLCQKSDVKLTLKYDQNWPLKLLLKLVLKIHL
jgi:hypothetical protein